ncbi:fukutin isoform X2 [Nerophis ophidion]|uniref:fukutin isoform X2 n=1 Tax=Nerophis ophidion TaxID=159077 RepID=UPI002ADFD009|nr:fukutin isoform X2 [Nerophis ophidion]
MSGPRLLSSTAHLTDHNLQWQTVKTFLALSRHFHVPLFLADVAVLRRLTHDALQRGEREARCNFLCTGRPVTSFAVLANAWKYDAAFSSAAEQKGFEVLELRGEDPRLASLDILSAQEIPLHLLLRLKGYFIQVVFLYERSGDYLWHGPLRLKANTDRGFAPFTRLDFGRYAGAYNRPRLVLTVLDGLDVRIPQNVSDFLSEQQQARFLECRHRDARRFLQSYPDDTTPDALDFRNKAKSLLGLAAQTLTRLHVPFWISSGTCLGWFRQCSIISYSRDVDIGIFISDFRSDIITAFQAVGLSLKHKFGKVEDSLELSFVKDDVKLDIFFFYQERDIIWNGGTQVKSGRKFKYTFPHFSLCWAELAEVKVRVPCQTLDYVAANYGPSWSVPLRTWDWKSSPSNVQENGVWPLSQWETLIQVY